VGRLVGPGPCARQLPQGYKFLKRRRINFVFSIDQNTVIALVLGAMAMSRQSSL
jgi:hypothetical protein